MRQVWTPNQGSIELQRNLIRFGYTQPSIQGAGESIVLCRTDTNTVEIHCHGGAMAARSLMDQCIALGAHESDPWNSPSFPVSFTGDVHMSLDHERIQCEAMEDLAHAATHRTTRILLDQARGSLSNALQSIEASLSSGHTQLAVDSIDHLLRFAQAGLHLLQPFRVVLAGPPNVGKSSLLNQLLGYSRAIVHEQAGTTRDLLRERTSFDGWPVELTDSAGVRDKNEATDGIEREGIERSLQQVALADCTLLLVSSVEGWTVDHDRLLQAAQGKIVVVLTKRDLGGRADPSPPPERTHACVSTSSLTGEGVQELMAAVMSALVPSDLSEGDAVPFRERHLVHLRHLRMMA